MSTILLVEDNPVNQMIARKMLEKLDCRVDVAGNGQEAVDLVEQNNYDLIFMDIHMPVMDGLQATQHIRKAQSRHIPIIAMTADHGLEEEQRFIQGGMDAFLPKPVNMAVLHDVVRLWLNQDKA